MGTTELFHGARLYIASRTRHAERWRKLRDEGALIVSTWIDTPVGVAGDEAAELWSANVVQAAQAAVCVVYVEPGDVSGLKGVLVEVGAALGADVQVLVDCDDAVWARLGSWTAHRLVTHTPGAVVMLERLVVGQGPESGEPTLEEPEPDLRRAGVGVSDRMGLLKMALHGLRQEGLIASDSLAVLGATLEPVTPTMAFEDQEEPLGVGWSLLRASYVDPDSPESVVVQDFLVRGRGATASSRELVRRAPAEWAILPCTLLAFGAGSSDDGHEGAPASQAAATSDGYEHLRELYADVHPQTAVMAGAAAGKSTWPMAPRPGRNDSRHQDYRETVERICALELIVNQCAEALGLTRFAGCRPEGRWADNLLQMSVPLLEAARRAGAAGAAGAIDDGHEGATGPSSPRAPLAKDRPPRVLTTGSRIGLEFTYDYPGVASEVRGSWLVPHDSDAAALNKVAEELGWELVYEIAKQPQYTVAGVRVVSVGTDEQGEV